MDHSVCQFSYTQWYFKTSYVIILYIHLPGTETAFSLFHTKTETISTSIVLSLKY